MDINDFLVTCINLETRVDRWEQSREEFRRAGLLNHVLRFGACVGENPVVGCGLSHFSVLLAAKDIGKHAMIFEDDVQFVNTHRSISEYISELDNLDWDMLYFGANITRRIKVVSDKFARVYHAQSTHAYCVNNRFIDTVLDHQNLIGKPMDLIYAENVIPLGKCYITKPLLAIQRPSYSDIEKKHVNYNWMEDRYSSNLS